MKKHLNLFHNYKTDWLWDNINDFLNIKYIKIKEVINAIFNIQLKFKN